MIAVIKANFNNEVTDELLLGCKEELQKCGEKCEIFEVPGAVELVFASKKLINSKTYQAIIAIGAVIKGDTDHYEYVCHFVTNGIMELNKLGEIPVIFGVLTVQNDELAEIRANRTKMNKGAEFAQAAVEMINKFN